MNFLWRFSPKIRIKSMNIHSRSTSTGKTYYDSQSGMYMKVPGSDGYKIHDVSLKVLDLKANNVRMKEARKFCQNLLSKNIVTSLSIEHNWLNKDSLKFKFEEGCGVCLSSDCVSAACKTFDDFKNLCDIHVTLTQSDSMEKGKPIHFEVDCLSLTALVVDDSKDSREIQGIDDIRGLDLCITEQQLSNTHKIHVNLYLDITSLLNSYGHKATLPAPTALAVSAMVGHLCDLRSVEVVNLVLSSRIPLATLTTDSSLSASSEDLGDYTREVLEECIGLDVAGTAVVDRLGLQGAPLEVNETASGLGVKRFSVVCDLEGLSRTVECDTHPSSLRSEIVVRGRDGQQLYCLTSSLQDIKHLVAAGL